MENIVVRYPSGEMPILTAHRSLENDRLSNKIPQIHQLRLRRTTGAHEIGGSVVPEGCFPLVVVGGQLALKSVLTFIVNTCVSDVFPTCILVVVSGVRKRSVNFANVIYILVQGRCMDSFDLPCQQPPGGDVSGKRDFACRKPAPVRIPKNTAGAR